MTIFAAEYMKPIVWIGCTVFAFTATDAAAQTLVNRSERSLVRAVFNAGDLRGVSEGEQLARTGRPRSESQAVLEAWRIAAEFATSNPEQFALAVGTLLTTPATAELARVRGDQASLTAARAYLARERSQVTRDLDELKSPADSTRLRLYVSALREALSLAERQVTPPYVSMIASSDLRRAFQSASVEDSYSATGSLGLLAETTATTWVGTVAIVGNQSTIGGNYGSAVLVPGGGNSLASALLDVRWTGNHLPLHTYLIVSKANWQQSRGGDATLSDTISVVAAGFGVLLYREVVPPTSNRTGASLIVELGPTIRWLDAEPGKRSEMLQVGRPLFAGFETGMQISVGRLSAAAQLYWIHREDVRIPGLTDWQFVAGIGVSGDVVPLSGSR
jgi:hypothetical protein